LAIDYYSQAIKLVPNETYYSNQAACYIKLGDWSSGLASCKEGLALGESSIPANVKLYWRKGVCEKNLGMLQAATESFIQGLEIDPDNKVLKEELDKSSQLSKQSLRQSRARRNAPVVPQRETVPVTIVNRLPDEWNENPGTNQKNQRDVGVASSIVNYPIGLDNSITLSLSTLIQFVRTPPSQKGPVYHYLFSIDPSSLPLIHGRAGVEHDTVELFLDTIVAERSEVRDPQWTTQSVALLSSLANCNRFSIAHMFVSTEKITTVFNLLEKTSSEENLSDLRQKWT
jgi:tetratricopeptide (TPR) repeat protein